MVYLNELSLKKELVLVNNSKLMEKDSTIEEYNNIDEIDALMDEYLSETYNIKKGQIEEDFNNKIQKCFIKDYTKEVLGEMVMLMVKNILRKHSFSGYTQEWKEDFAVDAYDKVFRYSKNFDCTKISERTNKRVKAFAYLTQIITQAFISVINKNNDIKNKTKGYDFISYGSMYDESFVNKLYHSDNISTYKSAEDDYEVIEVQDIQEIVHVISTRKTTRPKKIHNKDTNEYEIIEEEFIDNLKIVYDSINIPLEVYDKIMKIKPDSINLILHKRVPEDYIDEETDSEW